MQNLPDSVCLLFSGNWSYSEILVEEVDSTRVIDPVLEEDCKQAWNAMLVEAFQKKSKLWNSEIYRFESVEKEKEKLKLSFSTVPFSVRLGMNQNTNRVKKLGIAYASQGVFTSCFICTSDDKYVFIEKSQHYFTRKHISFIGGVVSKSERTLNSGQDLFGEVVKEIKEEVGVIVDIEHLHLKAGYRTENFNVCFLFYISVPLTFAEMIELFNKNNDKEAKSIFGLSKNDLVSSLSLFEPKDSVKFNIAGLV